MGLGAQPQPDRRNRHLYLETVFTAVKLTQNCYLHYNANIFLKIANLIINNWLLLSI